MECTLLPADKIDHFDVNEKARPKTPPAAAPRPTRVDPVSATRVYFCREALAWVKSGRRWIHSEQERRALRRLVMRESKGSEKLEITDVTFPSEAPSPPAPASSGLKMPCSTFGMIIWQLPPIALAPSAPSGRIIWQSSSGPFRYSYCCSSSRGRVLGRTVGGPRLEVSSAKMKILHLPFAGSAVLFRLGKMKRNG